MAQRKRDRQEFVEKMSQSTHCGVPVPNHDPPSPEWDAFHDAVAAKLARQPFIDRTIIALFARGYPQDKLFERAELLWRLREQYVAGKLSAARMAARGIKP